MVMRAPVGATARGAQHAQSLEAFFCHIPGLKVVAPATAYDAKGLLKSAVRDDNPVIIFEHKLLYGSQGPAHREGRAQPGRRGAGRGLPRADRQGHHPPRRART